MAALIEKNKLELIESINGIREDIGQTPYELEYLSGLSVEELQKMVDDLFGQKQGRLDQDLEQKEKLKFDFYKNITVGFLFVVIMLMIIFTISGLFL